MSQNPYAGGGPQPGYEAWYEQPRESSLSIMAVLSLIFSILCLTAPLGIIFGVASLFTIGASGGRKHGKGLAISGIVVGLVFSTCMTFAIVSSWSVVQLMQGQLALPAAKTLKAIEDGDIVTAKQGMGPKLTAAVTDEQIAEFRNAYQAELGKFKGTSQTAWEMIENYSKVGKAWEPFSQTQQAGRRNDLAPVVMEFEKGHAILGLVMQHSEKPENLVIFTNSGKAIWLVDPRSVPLPGTTTPSNPPETPTPPPAGGGGA